MCAMGELGWAVAKVAALSICLARGVLPEARDLPAAGVTASNNRNPRTFVAGGIKGVMGNSQFVDIADLSAFNSAAPLPALQRFLSLHGVTLLARNTVVSILTFSIGLALMGVLVELVGANELFSAGASFLAATSLHYTLGRSWVFRGTQRGVASGYGYFLINASVGLALTLSLFAFLISWTPMNFLVARVLVSIFAGLAMFVLNATLNFKQI